MNLSFIGEFFQIFLYQPLFNALVLIYNLLPGHDLGLAVIALTFIIKLSTLPLNVRAFKLQQAMARIQPQLKEAQKQYKDRPAEQARVMSEIFKKEKVNPWSSFVPLLIQFPILIALYQLFLSGLWGQQNHLYSFIVRPEVISPQFLGLVDLSQPNLWLAILAGLGQLAQSLVTPLNPGQTDKDDPRYQINKMIQKQMIFFLPFLTVFILLKLPSALGLYWLATSFLTAGQQYFLNKRYPLVEPSSK
ncbi:MAG: membrane protein insertase YidC [Candidatus Nealsonbacteria bacterium]|nr:membrane protein insertase YidC [Candidatus Nealsonbacteria bacterium]